VISELEPNLDPSISRRFGTVADEAIIQGRITVVLVDEVLGF
jgi:hypothetical protein